eukprot:3396843-Ditylum_brightwellii.AAC.1
MASSNNAIMDHFPVKDIPRQARMPTWESIQAIHLNLNGNAASVLSDIGGVIHSHLNLTIGGAEYQTCTSHAFVRLANPCGTLPPGNPMSFLCKKQIA